MQREGAKPKSRPVEDEPQQEPMRGSIVGVRRNPSTDQKRVRRNMNKKASELDAFSVKRGVCQGEGCGVAMAMPDKSKQDLCPNCLDRRKRDVAADQDKNFFDQTKASRKTASVDPNCVDCQKDAHNNGEHEDTPSSNCLYCQNKAHLNSEHEDTPHYNCVRCQMKNADAHYDDNHYFTPDSNCWECQFDDHLLGQHDGTPEPNCRDCQENAHNSGHADINTTASRKTAGYDSLSHPDASSMNEGVKDMTCYECGEDYDAPTLNGMIDSDECPNCGSDATSEVGKKNPFDEPFVYASRKTASLDPEDCVWCKRPGHDNGEHNKTPDPNCDMCQYKAHHHGEHEDTQDGNCYACQGDAHGNGEHDEEPNSKCDWCHLDTHDNGHSEINTTGSRKTAESENPLGPNRNRWGQWTDSKGNANAADGIDRCECGSKNWDNDRCNNCDKKWDVTTTWNNRTLSSLRTVGNRYPTKDPLNLPKTYGDNGGNCSWCNGSEGPVTKSYTDADEHEEAPNGTGFVPPKPQQRYMVCDSCFHEIAPDNQISGKANGAVDESLNEHPMTLGFVGGAPKYCDNCEESTAHDRGTCEDCGERNPRLNEWNEYDWESKAREGSLKTAGLAHYPADVNDAFDHLTKVHGQDPGEVLNEIYEHGYHTGINDGYPNGPSDDSPGDALKAHHSGLHSIIDGGYDEHFHHDEENPVLEVDHSLGGYDDGDQYNSEFKPQSSRKTATTYDVRADKLNPGDKVRDPYGGTSEVAQVRNHESGGSVYVDLKNGGTTVVERGAQFSLVPADTRQRMIPGPGVPGGNTNTNQDEAGASNELSSSAICPVCGGKGTMHREGDHYVCVRCGYTETAGGAGNQNYTTSPMTYQRRKTSSLLNVKENKYKKDWRSSSAIANRARAVSASEENQ